MIKNKGITLVEIIVGVAILLVAFVGLVTVYNQYIKYSINTIPTIQSSYLLQEGVEVAKIFRDTSWTNISKLSTTTTYYLNYSTSTRKWATSTSVSLIDSTFYRTLQVTDVNRDASSNIVSSGGTYDANSKLVTISVSWNAGVGSTTQNLSSYLTNLFSN